MKSITNTSSNNPLRIDRILALSLVFGCLLNFTVVRAQVNYKVGVKQASITLNGTSTLHDWKMVAHTFGSDAQFMISTDHKITGLSSMTYTLPVTNLKSESDGLNEKAYEALKSDTYKDISFVMTSAKITSSTGQTYKMSVWGNLTIAGVTKAVAFYSTAVYNDDSSISCSGSMPLKMSTYSVERPSFLFGAMKAGDAVTLKFDLTFVS